MREPLTPQEEVAAHNLRSIWNEFRVTSLDVRTQEELAEKFGGVTQSAISQYLNGHVAIGPQAAARFADIFGVHPRDIRPGAELAVSEPKFRKPESLGDLLLEIRSLSSSDQRLVVQLVKRLSK